MIDYELSHDAALDLAADAIDFELSPTERRQLEGHLAGCEDCRFEAELLREDDALLETGFDWKTLDRDVDEGLEPDEFEPRFEPAEGDEDDRVTVVDAIDEDLPRKERDLGERDEESLVLGGDDEDQDDLDEDDLDRSRGRQDDDEEEEDESPDPERDVGLSAGREGDDEEDDESPDSTDPRAGDGSTPRDRADGEPDEGEAEPDLDELEIDLDAVLEQAEAEAAAMPDEELGGVDSVKTGEDALLEETNSLVDGTALEHGVQEYGLHERAERIVRNRDGLARTEFGTVAVYRGVKGLVHKNKYDETYYGGNESSPAAGAAIRNAILRSRLGRSDVARRQPRGRLDSMSLHRIAEKDHRLFKRAINPSPGRFLVWVMVDVSGSMSGRPIKDACQVAKALADASVGAPTVRLSVWGWSDPFMPTYSAAAGVVRVWEKGKSPSTEGVWNLRYLRMGGTPDAAVLAWAWREILKHALPGERPVIVMASDGWGDHRLPQVIEQATKHGVSVKNVALGSYVHEIDQRERFGRGNYVPWRGSISATARPLATMVAKMAAGE